MKSLYQKIYDSDVGYSFLTSPTAILAAIITPTPDIATMMLMAVPMYALYEICIILAWMHERKEAARAREEVARFEEDFNNDNSPYNH